MVQSCALSVYWSVNKILHGEPDLPRVQYRKKEWSKFSFIFLIEKKVWHCILFWQTTTSRCYYFPSATHVLFMKFMKCSVYSIYLFIYLSSLAWTLHKPETLNSTVLVLDSSQSASPFPLIQQERIPQNMTSDSKLAHSVESVVQTVLILLLMSLSMKFNITREWPVSTTLLIKLIIDAPVHLPTPSNINI